MTDQVIVNPSDSLANGMTVKIPNQKQPLKDKAISQAEDMLERTGERALCSSLHRLRAIFLTAMGADEAQIEASFCAAIRIAKEQKSVSLEKRAEATYAEYRRQKASASGRRGFRLPLC